MGKIEQGEPNVYLVRHGASDMYKVGVTKGDPIKRIDALQTGNPEKLRHVCSFGVPTMEVALAVERDILKDAKTEDWYIRGEWILEHPSAFYQPNCKSLRDLVRLYCAWRTDEWIERNAERVPA